ncbi:MAG: phenylalanine--tRNA ligase subunit beta [Phycisphaerae bacterium]|nr:phenylalanine--tRNA ligase subunit beta [Phycisphaerae bacterium]
MLTSVAWINDYLDPPASDQEQADLLTQAGFPLEEREEVDDDVRQDFEMTSNRGDCTCHVGLAREIAAASNRRLVPPTVDLPAGTGSVHDFAKVTNECPEACPRYTARVIRNVKVAPSPDSIANRLIARGDIPRNNIVDATNFVLFELGQPTHVFDLDKLAGGEIVIRMARPGERFLPIGEDAEEIELDGSELVIADAEKPVALAGVKGGALTAVTEDTTNILLEAATFDPVAVRHTSRRHNISSDSSFRFERWVSPAAVDSPAERLASLILELAGGELCDGVCIAGAELPQSQQVTMRTDRCRQIIGLPVDDETMVGFLDRLGFQPVLDDGVITATVPVHRGDIEREVDLIEEVVRMHGFDAIPAPEEMRMRPAVMPPRVECHRAISNVLVASDFVESITHTLVSDREAAPFLASGQDTMHITAGSAPGDAALRPSVLASLLRVRKHNLDQGLRSLSLFEWGSIFHRVGDDRTEKRSLALLSDDDGQGVRSLRGVIDRIAALLLGPETQVEVDPGDTPPWYAPGGRVMINGACIGWIGRLAPVVTGTWGLDQAMIAAELHLDELMSNWPPTFLVKPLPAFPAIERDLSAIIDEATAWNDLEQSIRSLELPNLESVDFVTVYRGKGIDSGRKSLTMRLRFRSTDRTLRNEEVDEVMPGVLDTLTSRFKAEIRA